MTRSALTRLSILSAAVTLTAFAQQARADEVVFTGIGAGGLKFSGKTSEVTTAQEGDKFVVKVALKKLDTGIALRDDHMTKKYMECEKFPDATLTVARSALKLPESGESSGEATGTFAMHGKTKDLPFKYKATKGAAGTDVEGTLHLDFRDFGIEIPNYLGITVKPDVDVAAKFTTAVK
jgi:polyisoprenoid-binding protein YceI